MGARALRPLLEARFNDARRNGSRETHDAYLFDALVGLAAGASAIPRSARTGDRYRTLIRADITALRRGHAVAGETCEVAGVGPVSVAGLRDLLGDGTVELLLTKGEDVLNVTYLGRGPSAAQKAALLWSQPRCAREGCNRSVVEADHRKDFARTRHTRLDELDHLCKPDHDLKTYKGWALVAGTGRRPLVPPDDPRHPARQGGNDPPDLFSSPRPRAAERPGLQHVFVAAPVHRG